MRNWARRIAALLGFVGLVLVAVYSGTPPQQQVQPVSGVLTLNLVPGISSFKVILSANVTSVVITNPTPGTIITVIFTENATGGFTVVFGGNITNPCAVTAAANATTVCQFQYDATSNTWNGVGVSSGIAMADPIPITTADYIHVQNSGIFTGFTETMTWTILDSGGVKHYYSQNFVLPTVNGGSSGCTSGGVGNDNCAVQMAITGNLIAVNVGSGLGGGPMPGTDFLEVWLQKQASFNADQTQITNTLISTYMENANLVFWPGGRAIVSLEDVPGEGNSVWGTGTNPAAGADFSCVPQTVGNCSGGGGINFGNANLILDSIYFTYTSSSQTPANARLVAFEVVAGANSPVTVHIPAPATQAPSLTVNYMFCVGCTNSTIDPANIVVQLPAYLKLNSQYTGHVWRTRIANIQTSDTITNIQIRVRQKGSW